MNRKNLVYLPLVSLCFAESAFACHFQASSGDFLIAFLLLASLFVFAIFTLVSNLIFFANLIQGATKSPRTRTLLSVALTFSWLSLFFTLPLALKGNFSPLIASSVVILVPPLSKFLVWIQRLAKRHRQELIIFRSGSAAQKLHE